MLLAIILACEIAFWVVIVAGFAARYIAKMPRLGAALLISVSLIDVILLVVVTINMLQGATASWHHSVAALYIGFSIACGHGVITWADKHFHYLYGNGPKPIAPTGKEYTKKCWISVIHTMAMCAISAAILGLLIWIVGDAERTAALRGTLRILPMIVAVDFLWAVSYTIWPRRPRLEITSTPHAEATPQTDKTPHTKAAKAT